MKFLFSSAHETKSISWKISLNFSGSLNLVTFAVVGPFRSPTLKKDEEEANGDVWLFL